MKFAAQSRRPRRLALLTIVGVLLAMAGAVPAASAVTPKAPASSGLASSYAMNFDNLTYSTTADGSLSDISVDASGDVTGTMTVDPPLEGTGPLTGTLSDGTFTFTVGDGDYTGTVDATTLAISGTYTYPGQNGTWTATPAAEGAPNSFTVNGSLTSLDPGTQDTHATKPDSTCNPKRERIDRAIGKAGVGWATVTGAPTAADLLEHFLDNSGSTVTYGPGSLPATEVLEDPEFQALNTRVMTAVVDQLEAGSTAITLPASTLQTPASLQNPSLPETITLGDGAKYLPFTSGYDLYWAVRGTQYLTVTGTGSVANGLYSGTITYTIGDNYGLPSSGSNLIFGDDMRYLQINCGDDGGAHYFQDFITVSQTFTYA